MFEIEFGDSRWYLLNGRAALDVQHRRLVVADVHLGKAATFRALGVPLSDSVQQGSTAANLVRLSELIDTHAPRQVVFLGDLFHAPEALEPATSALVAEWRGRHAAVDMVLVEGNHDVRAGAPPAALGLRVVEEPWLADGVFLAHHPQWCDGAQVLAGHVHPVMRIHGRGDDSVRMPCFWSRERPAMNAGLMLLPAFGEFTGGAPVTREPGDRVIAIADDRLFEIPAPRTHAA